MKTGSTPKSIDEVDITDTFVERFAWTGTSTHVEQVLVESSGYSIGDHLPSVFDARHGAPARRVRPRRAATREKPMLDDPQVGRAAGRRPA